MEKADKTNPKTTHIKIRAAGIDDIFTLGALGHLLWPHHSVDALVAEFTDIMHKEASQFFLAFAEDAEAIGFAQCQLHYDYDFETGTSSAPQGYLEGIFVKEGYRRHGVAASLLQACEQWAKEQGCAEFGSDCDMDNEASRQFHAQQGFAEVTRTVFFNKKLS